MAVTLSLLLDFLGTAKLQCLIRLLHLVDACFDNL